jgi:deoxycytidylate deaminase
MSAQPHYDWNDLAFASKKPLSELNATFIAAPRELSPARFKQLVKTYLPKSHIILGLAKEPFVLGLENQIQFRMLELEQVKSIIDIVNTSQTPHKISTLSYFQRDLAHILEKLKFRQVLLVNGSWYQGFHYKPEYYIVVNRRIRYEMISPFTDEAEARAYADAHQPSPPKLVIERHYSDAEMLVLANEAAKGSFDYATYQTGCALGRKEGSGYRAIATSFNRTVPYQTYAMHLGSLREKNFTPPNDANNYDTNHYEVELLVQALRDKLDLERTTIFANVMHCPTCARMLSRTPIQEFVYAQDHSDGYAAHLLETAGKTVRRIINK